MTSALDWEHMPADGWTTDDLDALPEDGRRRELIDGVLIVSPSPTHFHQSVAARLMWALTRQCPTEYEATQGVEVRISSRRSLIPDVLVVTAEAATRNPSRFAAHDVVLAVEVLSPSSETMDRFTKPALYTHAGIPFFWTVEIQDGIVIRTYRLDSTDLEYRPTGRFDSTVKVDEPWKIEFPISEITPPLMRR